MAKARRHAMFQQRLITEVCQLKQEFLRLSLWLYSFLLPESQKTLSHLNALVLK